MFFVGFDHQLDPDIDYGIASQYKDAKLATALWICIIPSLILSFLNLQRIHISN